MSLELPEVSVSGVWCVEHRVSVLSFQGERPCCLQADLGTARRRVGEVEAAAGRLEAELAEMTEQFYAADRAAKDWEARARVLKGQLLGVQEEVRRLVREAWAREQAAKTAEKQAGTVKAPAVVEHFETGGVHG